MRPNGPYNTFDGLACRSLGAGVSSRCSATRPTVECQIWIVVGTASSKGVIEYLVTGAMRLAEVDAWARVVMTPLGLAGFALFILFSLFSWSRRRDERHWLSRVTAIAAIACLIGALGLSYLQVQKSISRQPTNYIQQNTTGQGSPAVQGVKGDVRITVDQSSGGKNPKKGQQQAAEQKKDQ